MSELTAAQAREAEIKTGMISDLIAFARQSNDAADHGSTLLRKLLIFQTAGVTFTDDDFVGENAALSPADLALFSAAFRALDTWMASPLTLTVPGLGDVTIRPSIALRLFAEGYPIAPKG